MGTEGYLKGDMGGYGDGDNTGPHGNWMQGANLHLGQFICFRKDK